MPRSGVHLKRRVSGAVGAPVESWAKPQPSNDSDGYITRFVARNEPTNKQYYK